MTPTPVAVMAALHPLLTPDLLKPGFTGHCYVASEVVFHRCGGKDAGLKPMNQRHEGVSHWWIQGPNGEVWDPTAYQFRTPVPYEEGRGRGFLTRGPSKRAQGLLEQLQVPGDGLQDVV